MVVVEGVQWGSHAGKSACVDFLAVPPCFASMLGEAETEAMAEAAHATQMRRRHVTCGSTRRGCGQVRRESEWEGE